jgi:acetylornithine/succinyldiaminopimelate/putrescine aminotransferase
MVNSFHGRTMGALSATGQPKYHKSFMPMLPGFKYAVFNDIDSVKSLIDENTCAIMMEPIQGEGGICPVEEEFIKEIKEICDKLDILLIFDEVQCGVGRTGTLFAYEQIGVAPDIMTLAKGLAGGVPIGAMVVNEKLNNVLVPGDHGATFGGNHLSCAAGCTVIGELKSTIMENVKNVSEYLVNKLKVLGEDTECIEFIKGKGLMIGVKLNIDSSKVTEKCLEDGLIINSLGNNMLRLVPPLVVNTKDVDDAIVILKSAILSVKNKD